MGTTDERTTGSTTHGAFAVRWIAILQHQENSRMTGNVVKEQVTREMAGTVVTYLSDYAKGVLAIVRSGDRLHSVPIDALRIVSETPEG